MILGGLLLIAAFAGLVALPFVPGLLEIARKRDSKPLGIPAGNARDPRFFANSFRALMRPYVEQGGGGAGRRRITRRRGARRGAGVTGRGRHRVLSGVLTRQETIDVHDDLRLSAHTTVRDILASTGRAEIGEGSTLGEVYLARDGRVGAKTSFRALACDGALLLGPGCRVGRWVDAAASLTVANDCVLGISASSAGRLMLDAGCHFRRLWGFPVATYAAGDAAEEDREEEVESLDAGRIESAVMWGARSFSVPRGGVVESDIVVKGDVHLHPGATVSGTIKAEGDVRIDAGAHVGGNVIARGGVRVGRDAHVWGNVFAEGDVELGRGMRLGRPGAHKSAYSAHDIVLGPGVEIHGWVGAEGRGSVL